MIIEKNEIWEQNLNIDNILFIGLNMYLYCKNININMKFFI